MSSAVPRKDESVFVVFVIEYSTEGRGKVKRGAPEAWQIMDWIF